MPVVRLLQEAHRLRRGARAGQAPAQVRQALHRRDFRFWAEGQPAQAVPILLEQQPVAPVRKRRGIGVRRLQDPTQPQPFVFVGRKGGPIVQRLQQLLPDDALLDAGRRLFRFKRSEMHVLLERIPIAGRGSRKVGLVLLVGGRPLQARLLQPRDHAAVLVSRLQHPPQSVHARPQLVRPLAVV